MAEKHNRETYHQSKTLKCCAQVRQSWSRHFSSQLRLSLFNNSPPNGVYKLQLTIILWSWEVNVVTCLTFFLIFKKLGRHIYKIWENMYINEVLETFPLKIHYVEALTLPFPASITSECDYLEIGPFQKWLS